jgi:hypothetical protein
MRTFSSIVALLALAAPAGAQSIAGNWNAAMHTPGGVIPFGLAFVQHGDTVTGVVHRDGGDVPLTGTMSRDTISFSYTISYNDHPLTLTMTAAVVGDSLIGTVDFAGQGYDQFWAARERQAPAKPTAPPGAPGVSTSGRQEIPW